MEWPEAISEAVAYIEKHITEDITMYDVAAHVSVSPLYFHKGFSILCGYTITEYIRKRRLALAGQELLTNDNTDMILPTALLRLLPVFMDTRPPQCVRIRQ